MPQRFVPLTVLFVAASAALAILWITEISDPQKVSMKSSQIDEVAKKNNSPLL